MKYFGWGIRLCTGWWFGTFFIFPYIGNNHPNWLIFFRGVETTNQSISAEIWGVIIVPPSAAPLGFTASSHLGLLISTATDFRLLAFGRLTWQEVINCYGKWWLDCNNTDNLKYSDYNDGWISNINIDNLTTPMITILIFTLAAWFGSQVKLPKGKQQEYGLPLFLGHRS